MDKLTKEDLLKIAQLLKIEKGIEIKVMPSQIMNKKGLAILIMHPDDMEDFKDIFKEQLPPLPFPNYFGL
jgi:hypothetical protein